MDRFSRTFHGYNPEEVNAFLDEVLLKVEGIVNSNIEKNKQIEKLTKEIEELKQSNSGLAIVKEAKQERNVILEEARNNADIIIHNAIKRSNEITAEAEMLNKNINKLKKKYKIDLEKILTIIDKLELLDLENK